MSQAEWAALDCAASDFALPLSWAVELALRAYLEHARDPDGRLYLTAGVDRVLGDPKVVSR